MRTALPVLLALLATACAGPEPGALDEPQLAAQALVELAQSAREPTDEELGRLFRDLDDAERAVLRDALSALGPSTGARVTGVEPLSPDRAAVDIGVELGGGGTARYSVQCRRGPEGKWEITSFQAPGVSWPVSARTADDEGLTISAPPG